MIRAVLDTNVLVSGLAGLELDTSPPGIILARWLAGRGAGPFELVVSPHILAELERTLTKPYYRTRRLLAQIEAAERFVNDVATAIEPGFVVSGIAPHPEDDLILATAVSAGANYLVTGDRRFQALGSYDGVAIVSPRAFLDVLEAVENPVANVYPWLARGQGSSFQRRPDAGSCILRRPPGLKVSRNFFRLASRAYAVFSASMCFSPWPESRMTRTRFVPLARRRT